MSEFSSPTQSLIDWFAEQEQPLVIAFSGGVDSSVVLAASLAARRPLKREDSVMAITAKSPSVPQWQLELAASIATDLHAVHRIIETTETRLPQYVANHPDRCFHCKSTLYEALQHFVDAIEHDLQGQSCLGFSNAVIVSGTNADDLGDFRPGIDAGRLAGVQTPLADLQLGKDAVRQAAREFGLANAERPASPCLASRIEYGLAATPERLAMVEKAEQILRKFSLPDLRVRVHQGELARIEVPLDCIALLVDSDVRAHITREFEAIGFRFITLDLQGLTSGSMNRTLVSIAKPEYSEPEDSEVVSPRPTVEQSS